MSDSRFKQGDRVKLKSGGPAMTVTDATGEKIECSWFLEGNIQHASFIPESLKILLAKKNALETSE